MARSPAAFHEPARLTIQWNRFASDLSLAFEASGNLQSWNPVAAILVDSTALDSTTGQATARISVPSMLYFLRLTATR